MAITHGTRLGVYEVLGRLGAGGMGEVYRALDTKLHRDVALKVLPDAFARDPERLARFEREAQVLASLNHPHIAAIYGLEESGDTRAIVMELVEGPTLADRIARGPIPADEAVPIARQIAEALAAAHEQGIIHRDLKPANIKVREDGTVKVLDFGLAKTLSPAPGSDGAAALANSPTITSPAAMTGVGMILGTAAYMSPEQAKGRPVDKRSDVWAFGCVLYEMLTGTRAFDGEDVTDVLGAVVRLEPNWNALPSDVPPLIRVLLQRSMVKESKRRVGSISAALFALEAGPGLGPSNGKMSLALPGGVAGRRHSLLWTIAGTSVVVAAALLAFLATSQPAVTGSPIRATIELGSDASLVSLVNSGGATRGTGRALVLSPDGRLLAFVAQRPGAESSLYLRRLDQLAASLVPGTEGAGFPFFSWDGKWVAFFAGGKLKKVAVGGGPMVTLCDVLAGRGGSWGEDEMIVFTPHQNAGARLMRVPAAGGVPEPVSKMATEEVTHRWPQVLPGVVGILYTAASSSTGPFDVANAVIQPLPTGEPKVVQTNAASARYLASGHLVFVRAGTLFAAPFDLQRLQATGAAVPFVEGLSYARDTGAAQFTFSDTGALAYVPGGVSERERAMDWLNRSGQSTSLRSTAAPWGSPAFSPDGTRLALAIGPQGNRDIWLLDWRRDVIQRLTLDGADHQRPTWTPDGQRIAFYSDRNVQHVRNIYWQRVDGTGEVQRLTEGQANQAPGSWHPGGRFLAFYQADAETQNDVMVLPLESDDTGGWTPGKPIVFVQTGAQEQAPAFSPDGRWLAYTSDETGRQEIFVRPFPGPGGAWQVSTNGGDLAAWSRTRRELIYRAPDNRLMIAGYSSDGAQFTSDKSKAWSDRIVTGAFALHPDGDRLAIESVGAAPQVLEKVVIVTNAFDELRRLAPHR